MTNSHIPLLIPAWSIRDVTRLTRAALSHDILRLFFVYSNLFESALLQPPETIGGYKTATPVLRRLTGADCSLETLMVIGVRRLGPVTL